MTVRTALRPMVVALLALLTAPRAHAQTARPGNWADRVGDQYDVMSNVPYRTASNKELNLDLYLPPRTAPVPTVVMIHGGGWVEGNKEEEILGALPYLALGYAVVNVQYRLKKIALAPAAVEDCRCALGWVIAHADEYKLDAKRIVVTGASAGGHLALTTGMLPAHSEFDRSCPSPGDFRWVGGKDPSEPRVAAIVNWYGITDVADMLDGPNARGYAIEWFGSMTDRMDLARRVSPINMVRPGLPPILTIHGDVDKLVPYSDATRLHAALTKAGSPNELVTIAGGDHGGFAPPETDRSWNAVRAFLARYGLTPGP
jgi:acetyl esterase/lipase